MKNAIIAPYAAKLRSGNNNPKNYPHWVELIHLLKERGFNIIQIGTEGEVRLEGADEFKTNLSFPELTELVWMNNVLILSVDSFFPHFCRSVGQKCVVLWGKSDPNVFGYKENVNILKDRKYLRSPHDQWLYWEKETFDPDVFATAKEVVDYLEKIKIIFA